MTTSKLKIVFSVLMVELCSAYGATVRTATEGFVTNRIAQAAAAATNYTDAATANAVKLSENKPEENARIVLWDYDATGNNPLVAGPTNLRVGDLVPSDYENISNRVMQAISLPGDEGHPGGLFTPRFVGRADLAVGAGSVTKPRQSPDPGELTLKGRAQEDAEGAVWGVWWPSFKDAWNNWHWVASEDYVSDAATAATNYTDEAIASIQFPETDLTDYATHDDVTNVVRACSLGGIWDAELEVWWTPVMVGGSLTYQATTNVNLNAEY